VQDWEVVTGYPDTPLLYILTRQQAAALISLAEFLEWRTRWENLPVDADIDAFASETMFNLMNPITCGMLTECLEPLFDNLRAQIKQDNLFEQYGTQYPAGVPLPPEALEAPLAAGSNPTCDLDIVWSQAEQLVDYSNTMITDTLEQVETATNNIELAQVITSLPILDELGADAIAGYIELLLDGVAENYAAEFDLAYRNTLACEIFCSAQGDCEITIQKVYDILLARVTGHFGTPGEALSTIGNLLSYLVDQDIDGDVVVDTLFFLLWGGAKLINSFIQDVGTTALETIMTLAVNDANSDWETLCDCPPECLFMVQADIDPTIAGGQDSGIAVTSGIEITIFATGLWRYGTGVDYDAAGQTGTSGNPSAVLPAANLGQILWKVGIGGTWEAGDAAFTRTPSSTGNLYFAMNDVPGAYGDNTGELCITVEET